MFDKKSQIDALKKNQASLIRQEKKQRKILLELEMSAIVAERKSKIARLEELEKQFQTLKSNRKSTSTKLSKTHKTQKLYLEHLRQRQLHATDLLAKQPFLLSSNEDHSLNEENLKKVDKSVPIKISVLLPHSEIQKKQKVQPPSIQRVLPNGDACRVYLVEDNVPKYNPLVKAEISVDKDDMAKGKVLRGEIFYNEEKGWKSISPQRRRKEDLELSKPDIFGIRQMTPQMKAERYNYRNYSIFEMNSSVNREWVQQRMQRYAKFIQNDFKPRVSEKKQIEMEMLKEKTKIYRIKPTEKFKLQLG